METHTKNPNDQNNPKKEDNSQRNHAHYIQTMLQGHSNQNSMTLAQKQTHRSMEQDRVLIKKPTHLVSITY